MSQINKKLETKKDEISERVRDELIPLINLKILLIDGQTTREKMLTVPEDKCFYGKPLKDLFHTCQENFAMDVDLQNRIIVDDKITGIIALESMGIINNYLLVS